MNKILRIQGAARQRNISLEEEMVLIQDNAMLSQEVQRDFDELNRVNDLASSLEDLAVVADRIETVNPNEELLIETIGNVAVSGTATTPEGFMPALEDIKDNMRDVSRAVREKARKILEAILSFIKRVWQKIEEYYRTSSTLIKALQSRADQARELLSQYKDGESGKGFDFELARYGAALQINDEFVAKYPALIQAMQAQSRLTEEVFSRYLPGVIDVMGKTTSAFTRLSTKLDKSFALETDQLARDINENARAVFNFEGSKRSTTPTQADMDETLVTTGTLGGYALLVKLPSLAASSVTLALLERLQYSQVQVSPQKAKNDHARLNTPPTKEEATRILDAVDEYVEALNDAFNSDVLKRARQARQALENVTKKLVENWPVPEDSTQSELLRYVNALSALNIAMANWTRSPAFEILAKGQSSANALIGLVKAAIKHE